jgi:hypothetical protein
VAPLRYVRLALSLNSLRSSRCLPASLIGSRGKDPPPLPGGGGSVYITSAIFILDVWVLTPLRVALSLQPALQTRLVDANRAPDLYGFDLFFLGQDLVDLAPSQIEHLPHVIGADPLGLLLYRYIDLLLVARLPPESQEVVLFYYMPK